MYDHSAEWWGVAKLAFVDEEDERGKYLTYNRRLKKANPRRSSQLSAPLVPILLQFLLSRVPDGIEDLLPRLFGVTIDRLWQARLNNEVSGGELVKIGFDTMGFLMRALNCLVEKCPNQSVMSEIADALVDHHIFDFIVQTAFLLPARSTDVSPEEDPGAQFVDRSRCMFESVSKILPEELLHFKFKSMAPDLRKYIAHALQWWDMQEDYTAGLERFRLLSKCIVCIGYNVGMEADLKSVHRNWGLCSYARCPAPRQRELLQFACDGCGMTYCNRNCLAGDWMYGSMRKWHKLSCGNILPRPPVEIPWGIVDGFARALTQGPNRFPIEEFMY
ncbi:hypothetical protein RSAG8_08225, partial [Rhizoctonia solani AG-8 WAC10335]